MDKNKKDFADLFRETKIGREITFREIASRCCLSISYLSDIAARRKPAPNLEIVAKIEQILGIKNGALVEAARRERFKPSCEELKKELELNEKLLSERNKVLKAIPDCEQHGGGCVPNALIWISDSKIARDENDRLKNELGKKILWNAWEGLIREYKTITIANASDISHVTGGADFLEKFIVANFPEDSMFY